MESAVHQSRAVQPNFRLGAVDALCNTVVKSESKPSFGPVIVVVRDGRMRLIHFWGLLPCRLNYRWKQ